MSENVWIEIRALRVEARIGVTDAELEVTRPLLIDLDLIPLACPAMETDAIEDTLDYAAVSGIAEAVATEQPHRTLERLAARIADAILAAGGCEEVGVRVAKPSPPMPHAVESVAVRIAKGAGEG